MSHIRTHIVCHVCISEDLLGQLLPVRLLDECVPLVTELSVLVHIPGGEHEVLAVLAVVIWGRKRQGGGVCGDEERGAEKKKKKGEGHGE